MTKRADGTGGIERLASGRVRARIRLANGRRESLGTFDTVDEANEVIAAALELLEKHSVLPTGGTSFRGYARRYADELEISRAYVAIKNFRSLLKNWIEKAPFADWPIQAVTPQAVRRWITQLSSRPDVSDSLCGQCLVNTRQILEGATREGLIDTNPARGVRQPRRPKRTDEPWTYLSPAEQEALITCEAIPEHWRLMIAMAIYTGMRWGELVSLKLEDLHLDDPRPHVVVRFGKKDGATKSGRIRRVPILPALQPLLKRWLELQPKWGIRNPAKLVWPGRCGGYRKVSRLEERVKGRRETLRTWLKAAGIRRHVRPHDFRHTCAASLISGWWGRAWRLEEVRDFLGHANIEQTERYAHLSPDVLHRAAAETPGPEGPGPELPGPGSGPRILESRSNHAASWSFCSGLPSSTPAEQYQALSPASGPDAVHELALRLLQLVAAGESPGELPESLAEAVLTSREVRLARAVLAGGPHAIDRAVELADALLPPCAAPRAKEGA